MYKEKIFNVQTGETTWRDLTAEEVEKIEQAKIIAEKQAQETEQIALAKNALLEKLGITQEEAKLLLS